MLLVLDVGNTNTVLGVFEPKPGEGATAVRPADRALARDHHEIADRG